ncbi:MAG: phytanoyl-CoA dioxygenase family protein [Abitibacteriaceae bacterium]|nr:phytanoyl-CoA dioxygenase family protein [Abditibacteriaceae bacterium]
MHREPIFQTYQFGPEEKERLDVAGHFLLPGLLTPQACLHLTESLTHLSGLRGRDDQPPQRYSAEYDAYLASLIAHPQMLELAHKVLGPDIRFDHCVSLNRPPEDRGIQWHSHDYADDRPELGFVRIFFYVNGFTKDDGGLKVVPGSHLFRDAKLRAASDEELRASWLAGKQHPHTGQPLEIECLDAPPGTVALMWTHAAHAVTPRQPQSETRWAVVYAYRNPGATSRARWITEEFERQPPPGAEGLMSLY